MLDSYCICWGASSINMICWIPKPLYQAWPVAVPALGFWNGCQLLSNHESQTQCFDCWLLPEETRVMQHLSSWGKLSVTSVHKEEPKLSWKAQPEAFYFTEVNANCSAQHLLQSQNLCLMSSKDVAFGVGAHWSSTWVAQRTIQALRMYLPGAALQDRAEILALNRNKQL